MLWAAPPQPQLCDDLAVEPGLGSPLMLRTLAIGLDLAKCVCQSCAIAADGMVVARRQLRRSEMLKFFGDLQPCLIGMEACASAHRWGRELCALGHEFLLMPPGYVKPHAERGKTDAADRRRPARR
jgi:transposase